MTSTVQLSHLDINGFLSIGTLINYMQNFSTDHLAEDHALTRYFREHNLAPFISSRQLEIKRLPTLGEHISVKTSTYKCSPIYGFRNVMVYDEAGEVLVASNAVSFFVDINSGHVTRVPQEILGTVVLSEPENMDYLPRKVLPPTDITPEEKERMYVWRFLLDANRHVNNAKYVQIAQEYIPADFYPARVRVEYQHAAHYGDYIHPKVYTLPNGYFVDLASKTGKHYALVEFSR